MVDLGPSGDLFLSPEQEKDGRVVKEVKVMDIDTEYYITPLT